MKKITEIFTRPIAHRGLHDAQRIENSLSAFEAAKNNGFGFELDIHMIKDGTIIVHHDYNLKRLCGVDVKVADLVVQDLAKYPFFNQKEHVPTLQEVLDFTMGEVPILIELKIAHGFDPIFPDALLKVLEKYPYKDKIALQSFNPYAIRWLKAHTNDFSVGQLSSGKLEGQKPHIQFLFKTLLITRISKPDFVSYDINYLPNPHVKRLRKRGMAIIAWTIDSELRHKNAILNADQFIFENIKV
ncbi:MAG TPA: hypothetical protein DCX17_03155 [Firmicutes bacterium]|jgi:glycerophosphoryl diester phosphodiesterase|nr:hypothetical protein [Bacillota bacterium]